MRDKVKEIKYEGNKIQGKKEGNKEGNKICGKIREIRNEGNKIRWKKRNERIRQVKYEEKLGK